LSSILKYTGEEFNDLLDEFSWEYKSKLYKNKIPYDIWKSMREKNCSWDKWLLKKEGEIIRIYSNSGGETKLEYETSVFDEGFGEFLSYGFYEEGKKLTYNSYTGETNSIADGTNWTNTVRAYDIDSCTGLSNQGTSSCWSDCTTVSNLEAIKRDVDDIKAKLNENKEKKEESKNMKGFNFDFGPCGNDIHMSMYGLAIKNINNEWVSYDKTAKDIINVDILNIADAGKYMYKMPVAVSDVRIGDVVVHNGVPMFVTGNNHDGSFSVVDVRVGEAKAIIPTKNMFGFNFMTKVVNMFDNFMSTPNSNNPFGNMLPFLMMGDNKNFDPMMFMFMMGQNGFNSNDMFSNPMMMYMLMKDNKNFDPMMLMFMMNQKKPETYETSGYVAGWTAPTADVAIEPTKVMC
jgi:hypothetical protein